MRKGLKIGIIFIFLLLIVLIAAMIAFFVLYFGGTKHTIEDANAYIEEHRADIDTRYRHSYHLMPEIGWCNDPNGFCFYEGEIHLFYQ